MKGSGVRVPASAWAAAGTLRRLAEALGGHALLGFEFGTDAEPARELVTL
jgi:hypothetical protein